MESKNVGIDRMLDVMVETILAYPENRKVIERQTIKNEDGSEDPVNFEKMVSNIVEIAFHATKETESSISVDYALRLKATMELLEIGKWSGKMSDITNVTAQILKAYGVKDNGNVFNFDFTQFLKDN